MPEKIKSKTVKKSADSAINELIKNIVNSTLNDEPDATNDESENELTFEKLEEFGKGIITTVKDMIEKSNNSILKSIDEKITSIKKSDDTSDNDDKDEEIKKNVDTDDNDDKDADTSVKDEKIKKNADTSGNDSVDIKGEIHKGVLEVLTSIGLNPEVNKRKSVVILNKEGEFVKDSTGIEKDDLYEVDVNNITEKKWKELPEQVRKSISTIEFKKRMIG